VRSEKKIWDDIKVTPRGYEQRPDFASMNLGLWHTALVKPWRMFVILNASSILGAFAAMFVVPESTPLWIWATCSVGTIAVLNFVVYRRIRGRLSNKAAATQ
jgi:hypothetical protein